MAIEFDIANADARHAQGRDAFGLLVQRSAALAAKGVNDEQAVVQLIAELGTGILGGGDGTPEFWSNLWQVCGAAAFAAVEKNSRAGD